MAHVGASFEIFSHLSEMTLMFELMAITCVIYTNTVIIHLTVGESYAWISTKYMSQSTLVNDC